MRYLTNSTGDLITTSSGRQIGSYVSYDRGSRTDDIEGLALLGCNQSERLNSLDALLRGLGHLSYEFSALWDFNKFVVFSPITRFGGGNSLYNIGTGTNLVEVNDVSNGLGLISGDASGYFDTGVDPSLNITDFNNWSMGLVSLDEDNTTSTIDMGCTDSTNEHSIAIRTGGNIIVKNGTASITTAQSTGVCHAVMCAQDGTLKTFIDGLEVGASTSVTGAASIGRTIYVEATNNSGTDASHSPKSYGFVWVYNGNMGDEAQLALNMNIDIYINNEAKIIV